MTRERGSPAESKNCEILLLPTADRRFDTKVKCPTGRASIWVKFPTVRSLTRVKCPGIARGGGDGQFWNWLVHNPYLDCIITVLFRSVRNELKRCLKFADCRLQTADYTLQTADYRLQTAYSGPLTVDYKRHWLTAGRKYWRPQSLIWHNPCGFEIMTLWPREGRYGYVKRRRRWPRKACCILDSIVSPYT